MLTFRTALPLLAGLVLCGCASMPHESPETNQRPWQSRLDGNTLESGFATFSLDLARLGDSANRKVDGGFGAYSNGDTHFIGSRNARYRVRIKTGEHPETGWLTYEIREFNACGDTSLKDKAWNDITGSGAVSNIRDLDIPDIGSVRFYERSIDRYRMYSGSAAPEHVRGFERSEAGVLFVAHGRIYNLLAFQLDLPAGKSADPRQIAQRQLQLREKLNKLIAATHLAKGQENRCRILNSNTQFSGRRIESNGIPACAINPYHGEWPESCRSG
jgi:hypothetical protein